MGGAMQKKRVVTCGCLWVWWRRMQLDEHMINRYSNEVGWSVRYALVLDLNQKVTSAVCGHE